MVMVIGLETALSGVAQAAFDVNRQVIISLLESVVELKEAAFVPTTVPFLLHWYVGEEPPLVVVEVNTTLVPAHTFVFVVLIAIVGTTLLFTVMVMVLDVAVLGEAQLLLLVTTQLTISLLSKAELL